jgi:hypothetical protein
LNRGCQAYLIAILTANPYKRTDVDIWSQFAQTLVLCILIAAQTLRVYYELQNVNGRDVSYDIMGFNDDKEVGHARAGYAQTARTPRARPYCATLPHLVSPATVPTPSLSQLVFVMISLNLFILAIFVCATVFSYYRRENIPVLRLVLTNQPPDLTLAPELRYHIFLSHIWGTGQDQVAVIKRQLQHLMPGVRAFLDVDDMEDSSRLRECVRRHDQTTRRYEGHASLDLRITPRLPTPWRPLASGLVSPAALRSACEPRCHLLPSPLPSVAMAGM